MAVEGGVGSGSTTISHPSIGSGNLALSWVLVHSWPACRELNFWDLVHNPRQPLPWVLNNPKFHGFALLPFDRDQWTRPLKALWPPRRGYFGLQRFKITPLTDGAANILKINLLLLHNFPLILEVSPKKTPGFSAEAEKDSMPGGPFRKAPRFNSAVKSSSRKGS